MAASAVVSIKAMVWCMSICLFDGRQAVMVRPPLASVVNDRLTIVSYVYHTRCLALYINTVGVMHHVTWIPLWTSARCLLCC